MNWLSLDHSGNTISIFRPRANHGCVPTLKIYNVCKSKEAAAMERPSGDHRGSVMPRDPGRMVILWLSRSKMRIRPFGSWAANEELKTTLCPSGDRVTLLSA